VEDLFISVADKFIFEDTFAFVSPESNQEEFRSDLLFDVVALLDNFILRFGSNSTDALEHSAKLTNVKDVVELSGSRQESIFNG